jgi:hypothetical protein
MAEPHLLNLNGGYQIYKLPRRNGFAPLQQIIDLATMVLL